MIILRLLALCPLLALAGCDTTSWSLAQATAPASVPCTSLSDAPSTYPHTTPQQREQLEAQPAPMC